MKLNGILAVTIINAIAWIATAIVAVVAMNITSDPFWSLLLLIPALCGYSYKEKGDK